MPQALTDANGMHVCIMVDGETEIPTTSRYGAECRLQIAGRCEYSGICAGTGKARRLSWIRQNGIRITIPYLTTASQYNQRIVVVNLDDVSYDYSMTFHPEAGVEVEGGANAMGSFASGTTVLSVARDDVVTIIGDRTRTAARITIAADEVNAGVSVATTQVNIGTGATDTVSYR